ncbi:Tail assembly chaperone [Klebsiella variicola]|uniref:hypothetical protein n=1 Tax=Klebsiella variicola TaxID=244366 RepID=UPI00109B83B5|nr:hypothetical protein [Klebsiella variicola]VGP71053.1 hypothetical protein SB5387_01013 [Klebsiella variicola]
MSQITVKDAPQSVQPATEESNVVVDAKGRHIVIRELSPIQEGRLFLAVGAEFAENSRFMSGYAFPAAMVESIDGEEYAVPSTMPQIEARLAILGHEGLNAMRQIMLDALRKAQAEAESSGVVEQAAKN